LMLFLLGSVACLAAFTLTQQLKAPAEYRVLAPRSSSRSLKSTQRIGPSKKKERFVYPYSVIPGGVQSREELAAVIGSDKVVADHYAGFNVSQARIVHAPETQYIHVAYRAQNRVYWTARKIRILKGESLITDGTEMARTRCGNRVSAVPLAPVYNNEPALDVFDLPVLASVEVPELESPQLSMEFNDLPIQPYIPAQRPTILPYYYRPLFVVQPEDVVVPEPATLSLLAVGLVTLLTVRFARKK
jgi:hypothetical protein